MSLAEYLPTDELHVDSQVADLPTAEHDLWRAVWDLALYDAVRLYYPAIAWLLTHSRDVTIVADLAGVDLRYYRPRIHALLLALAQAIIQDGYHHIVHTNGASVRSRRAKPDERRRAQQFLRSPLGRHTQADVLGRPDLQAVVATAYANAELPKNCYCVSECEEER